MTFKAKDAKLYAHTALSKKEIDNTVAKIRAASSTGKYKISILTNLTEPTINYLKDLGYVIGYSNAKTIQDEGIYHVISWM